MLLGICGKGKSGKSTVVKYLCEIYDFTDYNLRSPMNRGVLNLFVYTKDKLWGSGEVLDDIYHMLSSTIVNWAGSEVFLTMLYTQFPRIEEKVPKKYFWTQLFDSWYMSRVSKYSYFFGFDVVVYDIKYLHEVEIIKKLGGKLIKVERKLTERSNHDDVKNESDLIQEDYKLDNNGGIRDLFNKIDTMMYELMYDIRKE